MPVVGTAGHVDHGKSTLVEALTGRDPDRWDEEQQRGLTIDLGFAWTTLDSGLEVGFVDVPGHERFIKNMLAGIEAIDVVVFTVAADEGWMPQSEEHLAVLDLLGVRSGVVALTRADLVDTDTLEFAMLEVDEMLSGTTLEGSPIIPTAAPRGDGIAELRAALDDALDGTVVPDRGRPRMWVDRSFTIEGAGTVVTGTLVDGSIAVDDTLALFPGGITTRVRGIQSHERSTESVEPGNRTALNMAGIEREQIERGAMIGRPGDWAPTRRFVADLRTVRALGEPLREQGSYHLHAGSGSWTARLRLLEGDTLDGSGAAIVELTDPLPLQVDDRVILREVGRQAVVAGGRVLDPEPPRRAREAAATLEGLREAESPDEAATALLEARGVADVETLAAHTGGGTPDAALATDTRAFAGWKVERTLGDAGRVVADFHAANPLRPGVPKASLAEQLDVTVDDLEAIVAGSPDLVAEGPVVRAADFGGGLDAEAGAAWEALREQLLEAGLTPPRRKEIDADPELMHALLRDDRLVAVSDELVYLPETLEQAVEEALRLPDGFTVADFRDATGTSRKYAVPLLEWMDEAAITRREGEGRVVRRQRPDERGPGGAPSR